MAVNLIFPNLHFTADSFTEKKIKGSEKKVYTLDIDFGDGKHANISVKAKTLKVGLEMIEVLARQIEDLDKDEFDDYKRGRIHKPFYVSLQERKDVDHVTIYKTHRLLNSKHGLDYAFFQKTNGQHRLVPTSGNQLGISRMVQVDNDLQIDVRDYARYLKRNNVVEAEVRLRPLNGDNDPTSAELRLSPIFDDFDSDEMEPPSIDSEYMDVTYSLNSYGRGDSSEE